VPDQSRPIVKICGLSTVAGVNAALASGADAIGFILAPSRRQVSAHTIAGLLSESDRGEARAVGVFVNATAAEINAQASTAGLDVIQLSGDESPEIIGELDRPVWKALRFDQDVDLDMALAAVDSWYSAPQPAERVLLDGAPKGEYGGSGHTANWQLAAALARRYPIVLAGGLRTENVAGAIAEVKPAGVDTSSGVERLGQKDPELIRSFIGAARQSFGSSSRSSGA